MPKQSNPMKRQSGAARRCAGFSLIELMVALVLGLVLTYAMLSVFITSKTAFRRQEQLNSVQQSVRMAFEYLANDARMVGHLGCYTGRSSGFNNTLAATALATNYAIGVEGYEYTNPTLDAYPLSSNSPNDVNTAAYWTTNTSTNGINTIPVVTIGGANGLTPGSDVLVVRTVAGRPARITADAAATDTTLSIENFASGNCGSTTAKVSGICQSGHVLISSCQSAVVSTVSTVTAASPSTLTVASALGAVFPAASTEVFPMQSIAYYVKKSSSATTTSLYRRIFDGDSGASGVEQELIEGVENLQVKYGLDITDPADGVIDGSYLTANQVGDWSKVVAVRVSVLLRAADPLESDTTPATTGKVNGVTVTYPTSGSKYDRRVFTTTIAVRNRISYF